MVHDTIVAELIMSDISDALADAAGEYGETVTYWRDGVSVVSVTAMRGSTNWSTDAPFAGFRVGERSTDWIIATADLIDGNDDQITPERGDEIKSTGGESFRVMPFAKDSPLWQWVDRSTQSYRRIFTKERS